MVRSQLQIHTAEIPYISQSQSQVIILKDSLVCLKRPGKTQHIFTPDRKPMADPTIGTMTVQLDEPMGFTGAAYRSRNDSKLLHL